MVQKFPVWIYVVLAVQFLSALALCAFVVMLGSAFSGKIELDFAQSALIFGLLALPVLSLWLARTQWRAGRSTAANMLAFAPILLFFAISAVMRFLTV